MKLFLKVHSAVLTKPQYNDANSSFHSASSLEKIIGYAVIILKKTPTQDKSWFSEKLKKWRNRYIAKQR